MKLFAPRRASMPDCPSGASVRLVIVEEGARELDSRVPSGHDDVNDEEEEIVVTQSDGELPVSLMLRVGAKIVALERARKTIGRAVLVAGPLVGSQVSAARVLVTRAVFSHMVARGTGVLWIVANGVETDVKHDLMSLVEELLGEYERCTVPIRLRIQGDATRPIRESGIHRVAHLRDAPRIAGSRRR